MRNVENAGIGQALQLFSSAFVSILQHNETGHPQDATDAAHQLEHLSRLPGLDAMTLSAAQVLARRCQLLAVERGAPGNGQIAKAETA